MNRFKDNHAPALIEATCRYLRDELSAADLKDLIDEIQKDRKLFDDDVELLVYPRQETKS